MQSSSVAQPKGSQTNENTQNCCGQIIFSSESVYHLSRCCDQNSYCDPLLSCKPQEVYIEFDGTHAESHLWPVREESLRLMLRQTWQHLWPLTQNWGALRDISNNWFDIIYSKKHTPSLMSLSLKGPEEDRRVSSVQFSQSSWIENDLPTTLINIWTTGTHRIGLYFFKPIWMPYIQLGLLLACKFCLGLTLKKIWIYTFHPFTTE